LPLPFFVLATQNPLEMEGTYPLPEAQLDRFFFKLLARFPNATDLVEITKRTTKFDEPDLKVVLSGEDLARFQEILTSVPVADPIMQYAANLVLASHPAHALPESQVRRFVSYGASPRGMQAIVRAARAYCALDNRTAVSIDDIRKAAVPAMRHRIILNFEGEAEQVSVDSLVEDFLNTVPTPAKDAA
jgi:MoxR-like ATPase